METIPFIKAKCYEWTPQKDITAYELAVCIPILSAGNTISIEYAVEALPEDVRRHFTLMD